MEFSTKQKKSPSYLVKQFIWVFFPQNMGDHQTLFNHEHKRIHVALMSLSHSFYDVITLNFDDPMSNKVRPPLNATNERT